MQVGDLLVRINDIDSSTLTIQEAHDIILESGLQIKLAVTAYVFSQPIYKTNMHIKLQHLLYHFLLIMKVLKFLKTRKVVLSVISCIS